MEKNLGLRDIKLVVMSPGNSSFNFKSAVLFFRILETVVFSGNLTSQLHSKCSFSRKFCGRTLNLSLYRILSVSEQ